MTALSGDRAAIEAVLTERARLLARPTVEAGTVETIGLIAFSAGNERYAVEIGFVHRLEPCTRVTLLPGAPRYFAGITNLHGQLVPLVDLGVLLGAPACANAAFSVVLGNERAEIGLLADALLDIRTLPRDVFRKAASGPRPLVRHITFDGVAVIDGAAVIADPRLVAGDHAVTALEETTR